MMITNFTEHISHVVNLLGSGKDLVVSLSTRFRKEPWVLPMPWLNVS